MKLGTLNILNRQKGHKINTIALKRRTKTVLRVLDVRDYDLSVVLTNNKTILKYNKRIRGIDRPTDILSIPFTDDRMYPGVPPQAEMDSAGNTISDLGDIIISIPYVKKQCERKGYCINSYLPRLVIHGVCHLMGYEHETDEQHEQMSKKEAELLSELIRIENERAERLSKKPPSILGPEIL
mmetsp:Transcript_18619/g.20709  ORF Transcript_18619/g.20709 Transcript_18619/m.20709 type:complete len:182 (+) Transcript_18619:145-690(+)|eukprot:CAMPEP_0168523820 /NCGR_PEP_ID=MMETSP0405-20121227/10233_1 /TAXON_ID=498012 /ORGANISM="Trichosphaerium sp, Strain Am-I-7 wt" /LENGTH=181 /DNA_ID=CAMNT_0008545811 /DNA_START=61 /DNA_END=606 /DNA_ORIENTATION=-